MNTLVVRKLKSGEITKMNNNKISAEGIGLIKKFEGLELEAYQCSAGVWTIGYGHTKGVREGDVISEDHANHLLEVELEEYEGYVNQHVKVPLKQCHHDSLTAFVYNLGPNNFMNSTLLRVLNEGQYEEVPAQIKRWNKASGQVLEGLVRRREAEALLFEGKDWTHI